MIYKIAIIGSGPAGLTAGIYAARAQLATVVVQGALPGGQLMTTTAVENWSGNISIAGPDLMTNMLEHAKSSGCHMLACSVTRVDFNVSPYQLYGDNGSVVQAETVIIATGSAHKKLGCPGEDKYWGSGVSVCATCDAPFFKNKEVVVVGGGNSAIVEADHLAHFAQKVTIVQVLDQLSATDPLKLSVLKNPKISVVYNALVKEIQGDGQQVTQVVVEDNLQKKQSVIKTDGVFVAIGMKPNTEFLGDQLEKDSYGYLVTKNHTQTSKTGVFAAGEVADFRYRQAITSAGSGCMAALDSQEYLQKKT